MQSSNHILMIEPAGFHANPETMDTNSHQAQNPDDTKSIQSKAIEEHQRFRNALIANGVEVTLYKGIKECPDDLFCNNWISTHELRRLILYPMLAENRRKERREDIIEALKNKYSELIDLTEHEAKGVFLEGTGSLVLDRVNKRAYAVRSPRTDARLVREWCKQMDYYPILFDYYDSSGAAEYHTNVVMWIGSKVAALGTEAIPEDEREWMLEEEIKSTHEVIELSKKQIENFCGNALEVVGRNNEKMLAMSSCAYEALEPDQIKVLDKHYKAIIHSDLSTIEKYGGGSARCMMLELF